MASRLEGAPDTGMHWAQGEWPPMARVGGTCECRRAGTARRSDRGMPLHLTTSGCAFESAIPRDPQGGVRPSDCVRHHDDPPQSRNRSADTTGLLRCRRDVEVREHRPLFVAAPADGHQSHVPVRVGFFEGQPHQPRRSYGRLGRRLWLHLPALRPRRMQSAADHHVAGWERRTRSRPAPCGPSSVTSSPCRRPT
jgi:hypothetical protein